MRIAVPQTAKLHPYDRNPRSIEQTFSQYVSSVVKDQPVITYTAPVGRKAIVQSMGLEVQNTSAARAWGMAYARAVYNNKPFLQATINAGIGGDYATSFTHPALIVLPGTSLGMVVTLTVSAQVFYNLSQIILEFDA